MYQKSNHLYTELAKTAVSSTELYNLYGIVVDATTPHQKEEDSGKFKTQIRIIDPSMEGTGKNNSSISLNVTFLSPSMENLPTFKKVGEIIRIHRCTIGTYNNQKTFLINMKYGSSWAIFEGLPNKRVNTTVEQNDEDEEVVEMSSGDLVSEEEEENRKQKKEEEIRAEEAIQGYFGIQNKSKKVVGPSILNPGISNESSVCSGMLAAEKEIPVSQNYLPYKISSKDFTFGLIDRDILKRYRQWLREHFKTSF